MQRRVIVAIVVAEALLLLAGVMAVQSLYGNLLVAQYELGQSKKLIKSLENELEVRKQFWSALYGELSLGATASAGKMSIADNDPDRHPVVVIRLDKSRLQYNPDGKTILRK